MSPARYEPVTSGAMCFLPSSVVSRTAISRTVVRDARSVRCCAKRASLCAARFTRPDATVTARRRVTELPSSDEGTLTGRHQPTRLGELLEPAQIGRDLLLRRLAEEAG